MAVDGSRDGGFPSVTGGGEVKAMAVQPDGKVLVAGWLWGLNVNNVWFARPGIARLYGSPSQPIVQFGNCRACAINSTEGSAGSNGFVGVAYFVTVSDAAGLLGSNCSA